MTVGTTEGCFSPKVEEDSHAPSGCDDGVPANLPGKRRVAIGDDVIHDSDLDEKQAEADGTDERDSAARVVEPPDLATVAAEVLRLRSLVLMSAASLPDAVIDADEVERIGVIADVLDTMMYWAVEEAHYPDQPSQLSEVELNEIVVALLCCGRPRLFLKALQLCELLYAHPQSRSELRRCGEEYMKRLLLQQGSTTATALGDAEDYIDRIARSAAIFLEGILMRLRLHSGLVSVMAAGIRFCALLARDAGGERVLQSGVIAFVLDAMLLHDGSDGEGSSVRVAAIQFFAAVVDLKRDDPHAPSIASLLCHTKELMTILMNSFQEGRSHSGLTAAAVHFIAVCAARHENAAVLVSSPAYALVSQTASRDVSRTPFGVLKEVLEITAMLLLHLDTFQLRGVVLLVRRVLSSRGEEALLLRAVVLVAGLLKVASSTTPAPPAVPIAHATCVDEAVTLRCSETQWQPTKGSSHTSLTPSSQDLLAFMMRSGIPQLLVHFCDCYSVVAHAQHHDGESDSDGDDEEEDEEESLTASIVELSKQCVSQYMAMTMPQMMCEAAEA